MEELTLNLLPIILDSLQNSSPAGASVTLVPLKKNAVS